MTPAANDDSEDRLAIADEDLRAYADGKLGAERMRAVEGFLACNPDVAADVMRRRHMGGGPARPKRPRGARVAAVIGLAACLGVGVGWAAAERRDLDGWLEADGGAPPAYVEEAAEARQAAALRELMASQAETSELDVNEIRRRLGIHLPSLPADWAVRDVQVFPTDSGPAVHLVVDAPGARRLQLFAVRAASGDRNPELAARRGERVVFWQRGGAAYVLSGPRSGEDLRLDAAGLGGTANL